MTQVTRLVDLYHDFTDRVLSSGQSVSDQDVLAWMVLLHTHTIALVDPIINDSNGLTDLPAVTKRTAAELAASLWSGQMGTDKSKYEYWYAKYESETPFELVEQIRPEYVLRVTHMKRRLLSDSRVRGVLPEI
jgi:YD repeat-containing protein